MASFVQGQEAARAGKKRKTQADDDSQIEDTADEVNNLGKRACRVAASDRMKVVEDIEEEDFVDAVPKKMKKKRAGKVYSAFSLPAI